MALATDKSALSFVLLVDNKSAKSLHRYLEAIRDSEEFSAAEIYVLFPEEIEDRVAAEVYSTTLAQMIPVQTAQTSLADKASQLLPTLGASLLTVAELRRERSPRSFLRWFEKTETSINTGNNTAPDLLPARSCPSTVISQYIQQALKPSIGSATKQALGELTIRHFKLFLEYIDVSDGTLEFSVWNQTHLPVSGPQPQWQYQIVLRNAAGAELVSSPAKLEPRLNAAGQHHYENLHTRMDMSKADSGTYEVLLRLVGDTTESVEVRLRSRTGALEGARPIYVPPAEGHHKGFRFLLNTTGRLQNSYLTVQAGTGKQDARRWRNLLLRKDLNFILRAPVARRMRFLRLIRLITVPLFRKSEIWLIGERQDTAQDNGIHLFRYLRQHRPDINAYYVLAPSSPKFAEVEQLGKVVRHSSLRHQILMLHAKVIASAYATHHLVPSKWKHLDYVRHISWRAGSRRIYLKHGIHAAPYGVKRGASGYDAVLSATPRETQALREGSGYGTRIKELGLPRYDGLKPTPASRTILFAPTWRRYLPSRLFESRINDLPPFEGSRYESFITTLLTSPRLLSLLEEYDYQFEFLPHYNVEPFFKKSPTASGRIKVLHGNGFDFQKKLTNCDLFITDHSSVHFDVAFMETPVIYSRFDREEFERLHAAPSWFDFEKDGFGPVTYTLEGTLDAIEYFLQRDCAPDDLYLDRVRKSFTFHDFDNCQRATNEILRILADED